MFSIEDLLTRKLEERTGFSVEVGRLRANPVTGRFSAEDLRIWNPESFPHPDFLAVPEVRGHASPASLLSQDVRIRELSVHLGKLSGIRKRSGEINIGEFRRGLERRDEKEQRGSGSGRRVTIGKLRLRLDVIEMMDFAEDRRRREFPVWINETFSEIADPILLGPFLVERLAAAGLSRAENPIFASFLPDVLWMKIRELLGPSLAHLIGAVEK